MWKSQAIEYNMIRVLWFRNIFGNFQLYTWLRKICNFYYDSAICT